VTKFGIKLILVLKGQSLSRQANIWDYNFKENETSSHGINIFHTCTMKMEAIVSSETLEHIHLTIWRHIGQKTWALKFKTEYFTHHINYSKSLSHIPGIRNTAPFHCSGGPHSIER
jgi:hypothetical protein